MKQVFACLYLIILVSFIDSAIRHDCWAPALRATVALALQFISGFLALAVFFYLVNVFLFY